MTVNMFSFSISRRNLRVHDVKALQGMLCQICPHLVSRVCARICRQLTMVVESLPTRQHEHKCASKRCEHARCCLTAVVYLNRL